MQDQLGRCDSDVRLQKDEASSSSAWANRPSSRFEVFSHAMEVDAQKPTNPADLTIFPDLRADPSKCLAQARSTDGIRSSDLV